MSDLIHVTLRIQKFKNAATLPVPTPVAPTDIGGDVENFDVVIDDDTGFASKLVAAGATLNITPFFAHIVTPNFVYLEVPDKASLTINDAVQGVFGPKHLSMIKLTGTIKVQVTNDQTPAGGSGPVPITVRWYVGGLNT